VRSPGPNQKSDRGRGPFWRLCAKVLRRSGFGFIGWSTLSAVTRKPRPNPPTPGGDSPFSANDPQWRDTGAVLLRYLRTPTCLLTAVQIVSQKPSMTGASFEASICLSFLSQVTNE
jgi:hypothetical protein